MLGYRAPRGKARRRRLWRKFFRRSLAKAPLRLLFGSLAMAAKPSHDEVSARGGRSRSPAKLEAIRNNLEKARAALLAKRQSADKSDDYAAPGVTGANRPSCIDLQ